jgi:tripartite ATP-independent transporter DctP family solute receptor
MKRKRWMVSFFVAGVFGIFLLLGPAQAQELMKTKDGKIIIKAGHHTARGSYFDVAFHFIGKRLNEISGNKYDFQVFPAGQLGNQTELIQQLQKGSVHMSTTSMADLGNYAPVVNMVDIPFIFRDKKQAWAVSDGPIGDMMRQKVEQEAKVLVYGWWSIGVRSVFTSKKPIYTPADLKGMKIRVQPNPMHVAAFEALGTLPTPIAYTELYNALRQKVVDGAENDPTQVLTMKFHEACKFYSLTEHMITVGGAACLMSPLFYNALPPAEKEDFMKVAKEATAYQRNFVEEESIRAMKELEKLGVKINTVEKGPFQKAVEPFYEKFAYPKYGKDLVLQVMNYGK